MTGYNVGDIVSVEFPFSDLQSRKRRPGRVLVANDADLLLARFTTAAPRSASDIPLSRWSNAGLPFASIVRLTKLATVDARLVHHTIGHLHADDAGKIAQAWQDLATAVAAALRK